MGLRAAEFHEKSGLAGETACPTWPELVGQAVPPAFFDPADSGALPDEPRSPSARLTPDLRARIQSSFDQASGDEEHFPSTIDPRIWHVKLVREHLGDLRGKRVLDVGCGKGRFARIFKEAQPEAEIWGLDISEAMLRFVPQGIQTRAGSMTELPFEDAFFDGAYATESLEHAVEIPKAVSEICRVVKPGGRIAIIDKNAEQWGRLETPEWERWFTRAELEGLLARHCRQVTSRFLSYWEDVEPDGLFLAWLAVK
jgi:ubiquinone/menaquinone biosynthesis C-methylase UbiE